MAGTVALYISSMRRGGAERVIANLACYLDKKGYQVVLVTTHRVEKEYEIPKSVKWLISEPEKEELCGGRLHNFLVRFQKLRKIWKQEKPDVILSFIGKNNMMAILTALGLGIPVAVSVRGEPNEEYYSKMLRFLARRLFRMADGVILQTGRCMEFFPKSVRKKAVILKNPLNPAFFGKTFEGEREKTIVAVGRVDENKNHEMLIRAFGQLAEEFPEYKLTIYGEGEKRKELCRLAEELHLEDRISLPGNIDRVAETICKAGIFVLPSNTEGMPNTLLEAMALGIPVISTDCPCGGPAELIQDGINGILTPVGETEALRENLRMLLKNPQRAEKMAEQALKIKESYHPEKVLSEWEDYLNLLGLKKIGESRCAE